MKSKHCVYRLHDLRPLYRQVAAIRGEEPITHTPFEHGVRPPPRMSAAVSIAVSHSTITHTPFEHGVRLCIL